MHQDEIELFSLSALAVGIGLACGAVIGLFVGYVAGREDVAWAIFSGFGAIAILLTVASIVTGAAAGMMKR